MEAAVEVLEVAQVGQRRRLVSDRLGLGFAHGLAHRAGVEQIEGYRLRAERLHAGRVSRRPERADHLVPSVHELGDEPGANRTARSCNENSHRVHLSLVKWLQQDDERRTREGTALRGGASYLLDSAP